MQELLSKVLTYVFVIIIYLFIYAIIRMIFLDIRTMYRKKSGGFADAYLKLINLRHDLDFPVEESYEIENIFKSSGKFYIEDLDSTNGTFLNGEELTDKAVELLDGDKISLGRLNFIFVLPEKSE